MTEPLLVAKSKATELELLPALANRHGLIAGATGTGKTVTLQTLAQGLSRIGVPVFMADVKGDLSGLSQPGASSPKLKERLDTLKLRTSSSQPAPSSSGTCSASAATPREPRLRASGRCCSAACSG